MATYAGYGGDVKRGTYTIAEIKEWSLDVEGELIDTTDFSSTGWRAFAQGLKDGSGSFSGEWDMSDTNGQLALQATDLLGGASLTLSLYVDGSHYYSGTAFIESESISEAVDGLAQVTFNFKFSGTVSYS